MCGPGFIDIYNFAMRPMVYFDLFIDFNIFLIKNFILIKPIIQPGLMNVILDIKNTQEIRGQVKADLNIIRTVSGLKIPIRCYLSAGIYVGSCIYQDLCAFLKGYLNFDENNCPENFIKNGFDCRCPFNLPVTELNFNNILDLPDASTTIFTFLASGDFDVTIKGSIDTTNVLCLNMKYTIKPK